MGLSLNFSVTVTQQLKYKKLTSRVMLENQFISIIVMGFIYIDFLKFYCYFCCFQWILAKFNMLLMFFERIT